MDQLFMERALTLAAAGSGHVSPNPLVGAVLVRNGHIIGEGWHAKYGGPHAEQAAIDDALRRGNDPRGATLYCTLEPCSFTALGKHNPPCTTAIQGHGIGEVVLAIVDPNPKVRGSGIAQLHQAGIKVHTGVCARQAVRQNEAYILSREQERPYIMLKWAQSLDGCIATGTNDSKWISSPSARAEVHRLRGELDAVMVGSGSVASDNPGLTVRLPNTDYPPPLRVVLATNGELSEHSQLYREAAEIPTRLYCATISDTQRSRLESAGVQVSEVLADTSGRPRLTLVMQDLFSSGIRSVLVEGGAILHAALLQQQLYDRITVFTEPLLLGSGRRPTEQLQPATVAAAPRLSLPEYRQYDTTMSVSGLAPAAAAILSRLVPQQEAACSPA